MRHLIAARCWANCRGRVRKEAKARRNKPMKREKSREREEKRKKREKEIKENEEDIMQQRCCGGVQKAIIIIVD